LNAERNAECLELIWMILTAFLLFHHIPNMGWYRNQTGQNNAPSSSDGLHEQDEAPRDPVEPATMITVWRCTAQRPTTSVSPQDVGGSAQPIIRKELLHQLNE
jgi:hypothetical protein